MRRTLTRFSYIGICSIHLTTIMLQKIIDFFRSLFGMSPAKKETPAPPKQWNDFPETTDDNGTSEVVSEEDAQDGSEITPDTIVVTYEPDPVIDLPKIEQPPVVEETPPVVISEPEKEPEPENKPTENEPVAAQHTPRYLWCLDNGHGKNTAGKRSPKLPDGEQFFEYEFNRDIVGRIIKALDELGVKTYNVVPEVDTDNFLEGRVKRANGKRSDLPKLLVSVHANAAPARPGKWAQDSIHGIETWFYHGSKKGRKVASVFQKHLIAETGWKDRKIKSQSSKQFYVLRNTSMTAVLTENGFYNNKKQCVDLLKDSVRQKIADAHVKAIMEIEEKGIV